MITMIVKVMKAFIVLSSWHCHCNSSPGSLDQCTTSVMYISNLLTKLIAIYYYTIQHKSWHMYSFYHPTKGKSLHRILCWLTPTHYHYYIKPQTTTHIHTGNSLQQHYVFWS